MTAPVITVENLTKQFGDPRQADSLLPGCLDISLAIEPGETVGVVGESGSGKTTLGRCITGLTHFDRGKVLHRGKDISTAQGDERREFRRAIQIVFQNPETALNPRMTVGRFVAEALRNHRRAARADEHRRLVELAGLVGLNEGHLGRSSAWG
jgi:ABC-type glutathione transport system ATPase component